eukprot:7596548-Alexandrium_andersonii.AAC.1
MCIRDRGGGPDVEPPPAGGRKRAVRALLPDVPTPAKWDPIIRRTIRWEMDGSDVVEEPNDDPAIELDTQGMYEEPDKSERTCIRCRQR